MKALWIFTLVGVLLAILDQVSSSSQCHPDTLGWGAWGSWSKCNKDCDYGVRTRTRACCKSGYCYGANNHQESDLCNTHPCEGQDFRNENACGALDLMYVPSIDTTMVKVVNHIKHVEEITLNRINSYCRKNGHHCCGHSHSGLGYDGHVMGADGVWTPTRSPSMSEHYVSHRVAFQAMLIEASRQVCGDFSDRTWCIPTSVFKEIFDNNFIREIEQVVGARIATWEVLSPEGMNPVPVPTDAYYKEKTSSRKWLIMFALPMGLLATLIAIIAGLLGWRYSQRTKSNTTESKTNLGTHVTPPPLYADDIFSKKALEARVVSIDFQGVNTASSNDGCRAKVDSEQGVFP